MWGAVHPMFSRVLGAVVVIWAAVTISFFAIKLIPGDPVDVILGPLATISEDQKQQIRSDLGLDQPLLTQYLSYMAHLLRGDLGTSYQLDQPVAQVLGAALGPTLSLTSVALIFALLLVMTGLLVGRTPLLRAVVGGLQLTAVTIPIFWLGYVLLFIFAFNLGWFPAATGGGFTALVLPAVAIALPLAGILGQLLASSSEDSASKPFWLAVRARGVSQLRFDLVHATKHALASTLPLIAQIAGGLFAGAVITEQVFSRPGLGSVTLVAITNRDMPVVLGLVALSATVFAVLTLIAEVFVWMLDPRTRGASDA